MEYSQKISERLWNQPDKGELESRREATFMDDIVQKSHIEKALLASLKGVKTAFDGGGGSGRFSILLAKQGIQVTHFDISQPMLDKAAQLAEAAGVLRNMTFVKGALEDLHAYRDGQFDLVMSFDAPVSYTWPRQEQVLGELVRICGKRILLSVSSRLGSLPYLANPVQKKQFVLDTENPDPWVRWSVDQYAETVASFCFSRPACEALLETGLMGGAEEIAAYDRGEVPWTITYAFLPGELEALLTGFGIRNLQMAGPGAYARTIPGEVLRKIMKDPAQRADFLEFCYRFDQNPYVCGMGKDNLFIKGEKTNEL